MADLLREIDESMRADALRRLWDEHKIALATGVAALILGTAAYSGWNAWQKKENRESTGRIMTAVETGKAGDLANAAEGMKGNARAIALLNAGALALKANDRGAALEAYRKAEAEKSAEETFRHLGTLQKTALLLDDPGQDAQALQDGLKPVLAAKNSPFIGEALFLSAFVKGEKTNDFAGAARDLRALQTRVGVTESLKQRAEALQSVYDLKAEQKK
jgi:hypothetical protein